MKQKNENVIAALFNAAVVGTVVFCLSILNDRESKKKGDE